MHGNEISIQTLILFFGSIITILLSVIAFFLKKFIEDFSDMRDTVQDHSTDIAVINEHLKINHH